MIRLMIFLVLAGCMNLANASIQPRIVGGKIASQGRWPSAVALEITAFCPPSPTKIDPNPDPQSRLCGGNLIAPNWVLTAAHCLVDEDGEPDALPVDIRVVAGAQNLDKISINNFFRVKQIFIHPAYNSRSYNTDIALLELSTNTDQPAMSFEGNPFVGEYATAVGWGLTEMGGEISPKLREVSVPIVSNQACNADSAYGGGITDYMLCAGRDEGGKDSCSGDSGGPLMVPSAGDRWQQAGIVSFGEGCALPGKYGVYTRVAKFTDWIRNTMNGGDSDKPAITNVNPQCDARDAGSGGSGGVAGGDSGGAASDDSVGGGSDNSSGGGGGAILIELFAFLLVTLQRVGRISLRHPPSIGYKV